jgi:predicted ATPase
MKEFTGKLYRPGKKEYEGTAWLCSDRYALTAAHCVGDRVRKVLTPGTYRLEFDSSLLEGGAESFTLEAVVKSWNPEIDAALLSITKGKIPYEVQVKLSELPSLQPWPFGPGGLLWKSWGYAVANSAGMDIWGYIDARENPIAAAPAVAGQPRQVAIQLTCEQGGYDYLKGMSGAAVVYNNSVVGLVRWAPDPLKQRVIYAAPLKRILDSFPEVREIFEANLKRAINSVGEAEGRDSVTDGAALPRAPKLSGREADRAEVGRLLKAERARLLTLVGETGSGKTVLAQAVAGDLKGGYAHGVYFVDLSLVREPERVDAEIAHALGVKEAAGGSFEECLGTYLRDKQMLLVLDGFEDLESARALVERLLAKSDGLQFVVTCRAALGAPAERVYKVSPLETGTGSDGARESSPAVALFLERARRANPRYVYDPKTLGDIEGICEALGGLPLAIELAAALSTTADYGPADVRKSLEGAGDGAAPGARLAALVEMCYEALGAGARECLRRLAVFSVPVTPDAAEAVIAAAGEVRGDVRAELSRLFRRGLLHEERQPRRGVRYRVPRLGNFSARGQAADEDVRYRVPRPVLDFCAGQLEKTGEAASVRRAHAVYYAQLTKTAERRLNLLTSAERAAWLELLEAEHEEIRAALKWCLGEGGNAELGLEIVGNLFWFWNLRDYLTEAGRWAEAVLAATASAAAAAAEESAGGEDGADARKETESFGKALYCAGGVAFMHADYAHARARLEQSIAVWQSLGNRRRRGYSLIVLGMVALNENRLPEARAHLEECVGLFREVDDRWGLALSLNDLGNAWLESGDNDKARSNYEQSLAVWRELDDRWGYGLTTNNLGHLFHRAKDPLTAKQQLVEASRLLRDEGNQWGWAEAMKRLGHITFEEKDYKQAAKLFYDSMALHQKTGRKQLVADCLDGLARVAAEMGHPARSGRLFGAAAEIRRNIGKQMSAQEEEVRRREIEAAVSAAAKEGVTREEFEKYQEQGRGWTMEDAIAKATDYAAEWKE